MDCVKVIMLLKKNQIYQYQLAEQLGVTESYLSKVLRGREQPSPELVKKMEAISKKERK